VVLQPDEGYVFVDADSAAGYILIPNLEAIRALGAQLFGERSPQDPDGGSADPSAAPS
jgi:hypothetical protein